jgi:acyl-coenzyme A synthetase/AMP-(fatty) acid ligase
MNLASIMGDSAVRDPGRVALRLDDVELSNAQLDQASARVAGLLVERNITPGDRVGIMLPNVPYFAVCYYGVLLEGGVVVPINVLLKRREIAFHLCDTSCCSDGKDSRGKPSPERRTRRPSACWWRPGSSSSRSRRPSRATRTTIWARR